VQYLAGNDGAIAGNDSTAAFRDAIRKEESLLIVFGSEYRGRDIQSLVEFGLGLPNSKFAALGDYVNSHGAADMGLLPDLLPGYVPVNNPAQFAEEYGSVLPQAEGLNLLQMFDAAERGNLAALYVVGSNPVSRYGVDPASLNNTFLVVQDMFMTETAALANVIFPAANLYEKAGTVTNTYGDIQLVKKAADKSGVRTDFELIVRRADRMGADPKKLVPFGRGSHADMGQSRGVHSGEADRHAVWLAANHLEPKLSPFDPFAAFDEIQRLVPSYNVSRLELMTGTDQQEKLDLVQLQPAATRRDLVLPAEDTLFTSGTLGRFSDMLKAVVESHTTPNPAETAAD
jgi:NADH-quinone oxidoreductase subunit G